MYVAYYSQEGQEMEIYFVTFVFFLFSATNLAFHFFNLSIYLTNDSRQMRKFLKDSNRNGACNGANNLELFFCALVFTSFLPFSLKLFMQIKCNMTEYMF